MLRSRLLLLKWVSLHDSFASCCRRRFRNRVSSYGCGWLGHHGREVGGIRPADAPGFLVVQIFGAFAATVLFRWLVPSLPSEAKEVVFSNTHAGRE
jgi:hypothetical protein